jgi:general stress protein 26
MATTTFSTEVGQFADLQDDFLAVTDEIVWCTLATVDRHGRPRSRVMHVAWVVEDGRPVGRITTRRTPLLTAHLAGNEYVSCSYWNTSHRSVYADCRAAWLSDRQAMQRAWDVMVPEALRLGFDPYEAWPGGPSDPTFEVLRLDPWRVQITLPDLQAARTVDSSRVWHA